MLLFSRGVDLRGIVVGSLVFAGFTVGLALALLPEFKRKNQPRSLMWLVLLPLAGFIVIESLPAREEARGFPIETTSKEKKPK